MKGREYSRPVLNTILLTKKVTTRFNEGAGIFPPGVGTWQDVSGSGGSGFNEGAGIFPPGASKISPTRISFAGFNEGAGIFPPGALVERFFQKTLPASMKGREYSRPVHGWKLDRFRDSNASMKGREYSRPVEPAP